MLLDVHVAGTQIGELVAGLKAIEPPPKIVGYGSHVAAAVLAAAPESDGRFFKVPKVIER